MFFKFLRHFTVYMCMLTFPARKVISRVEGVGWGCVGVVLCAFLKGHHTVNRGKYFCAFNFTMFAI